MNLDNLARKILTDLIDQTIKEIKLNSPIHKKLHTEIGDKFLKDYFVELKKQLIFEIKPDNSILSENKYTSLKQLLDNKKVSTKNINSIETYIYQKIDRKNSKNKLLINIVFPSRNSSKIIKTSIELLISEIRKAHGIDFNVIFQVNNTSDNTIAIILESLAEYGHLVDTANFYVLETNPSLQFSLPGSLNLGFHFIKTLPEIVKSRYISFFSFWDDELLNLIPTPDSLFNSNLNELLSLRTNKAISGYMIDNRTGISRWHELSKGFSSDIRFIHSKPYLHGGSGTVMRLDDYPLGGIKLGGIADTDLSEHLLRKIDYKTLNKLTFKDWPVRSNSKSPVFHPIEANILKWTIKYLMYQIAWENTYKDLDHGKYNIGRLWKKQISDNRKDFHKRINQYIVNLSPEKILDREFMHIYYLTIQTIKNKKELYENLKSYRSRSLEIR